MIAATEDHLIDSIRFGNFRATASYVTERKSVRIPFLAPIYKPSGVTVMRATVADPGWLDCSTLFLSCLVTNTSDEAGEVLKPLTTSIGGAFQRGRLISGQVIEEVLEYGRVSHIYDIMKPKTGLAMDKTLGFATATTANGDVPLALQAGESKRVWHKPCFGLMFQDKWIPTNYAPLTFEFTLGGPDDWLNTEPSSAGIAASTSWEISDAFLYYDICILDAEVQSSYAATLRRGESLNVAYHSSLMQSNTVLGASFSIQILRNLARAKSIFVTLSRADEGKTKVATTQLWHPQVDPNEYPDSGIQAIIQIGGRRVPQQPIGPRDAAQLWFALQKAAGVLGSSVMPLGITYQEFLNTDANGLRKFIYATDMEKVLHAGYSGEDFGGGRALLIDMKGVGDHGAPASQATRCHVLLVHEAAMSISESGVEVTS